MAGAGSAPCREETVTFRGIRNSPYSREHLLFVCSWASNHMSTPTSPRSGDLLVREATLDGTVVYIVSAAFGTDQFLLRAREEAVVQAVTFAERLGVQAWWLADRGRYLPLTSARMAESAGVRPERHVRGPLKSARG